MKKKDGFPFYLVFLISGTVALMSVGLILYGIHTADSINLAEFFGTGNFVRSETVYLTLILALLLPLLLVILTAVLIVNKSKLSRFGKKKAGDEEESVRFRALCSLDEEMKTRQVRPYNTTITLRELCEDFRSYCASELHLYYEEDEIRKFVAGFAVSHLMVMQGLSGTGKTSLATAFGEYLQNRSTVISVQPMWKERADVIGYFNEFTKKFSESALLKKLYEARYSDDIFVIVLDEMNIARVEYFFADFLSLMELNADSRFLDMTSDSWEKDPELFQGGRFRIPENVWFIGTANNDDSTFAISDKVYDRAMVMNLNKKARPFAAPHSEGVHISFPYLRALVREAEATYEFTSRNRRKVAAIDDYLTEHFHITYGNRIRNQMEEYIAVYIACGGTEEEALDDFLVKKVLRKLEAQNPVVIAKASKAIAEEFETLFGEDAMPQCRSYLYYLKQLAS